MIEIPAATSTFREPGEVHLWRRGILNHRVETNQRSVGVSIRRVVEREWWDLSSKPERPGPGTIAYNRETDLFDGIQRMKDSSEMGRDLSGKVYPSVCAPVIEVYNDAGWVLDSVDEMSRGHFAWSTFNTSVLSALTGRRC